MALKVLSALDSARTQVYHFQAIIIAGMGLFSDSYDLFCIPPIMRLIGRRFYEDVPHGETQYEVPPVITATMVGIALLGTVIGQLVFGRLGDLVGRRRVYGFTLMLMVASSVGCGFSICTSNACVLTNFGFFRFLLGVGIGGDYPLSATIMSEFANKRTRGAFIAAVFSMQGFGILASSMVTMVVCAIFDAASNSPKSNHRTPEVVDLVWRLILMFGAIPAGLTYYWRMKMPETARFTALVEKNIEQATKDMERVLNVSMTTIPEDGEIVGYSPYFNDSSRSYRLLSKEFLRRHGRDLFSCAATWWLVDVVFYSINLVRFDASTDKPNPNISAYKDAYYVAKHQAIFAACSIIPGYFFTVYFIDRVGRVKIQIMGFFLMAVGLFVIGIPYNRFWPDNKSKPSSFLVLYGLIFFFSNFGPNTTTFIVPAELFPTRFRSTCHGISGAAGKVGAIIGTVGFMWAINDHKEKASLVILGVVCIVGMVITYFFTRETMGRSLEENEKEDEYTNVCFLRCFKSSCVQQPAPPPPAEFAASTA